MRAPGATGRRALQALVLATACLLGGRAQAESNLVIRSQSGRFKLIAPDASWRVEARKLRGHSYVRLTHSVRDEGKNAWLEVRVLPVRPGQTVEAFLLELDGRKRFVVESRRETTLAGEPALELVCLQARKGIQMKQ